MGCCASRLEKRWDAAKNNFHVTALAFVGGNEKEAWDEFPFDKVLWKFGKNGDVEADDIVKTAEGFKSGSEDQVKPIYYNTITWLTKRKEALISKHGEKAADNKQVWIEGKYNAHEVIGQLGSAIEALKAKAGIPDADAKPEEKKADAPAAMGEAMAMAGGEGAMMEGGEDGADKVDVGDGGMGAAATEDPYKDDTHNYEGWEQFGAHLLAWSIRCPYFGDLLRAKALDLELEPQKGWLDPTKYSDMAVGGVMAAGNAAVDGTTGLAKGEIPGLSKEGDIDGAAALVSALGRKNASTPQEVWFSGYLTQEFVDALGDAASGKTKVVFPFTMHGWKSKEEAEKGATKPEKEDNYKKVTFHATNANSFDFCAVRRITSRLCGTVTKVDDNNWSIAGVAPTHATRAAWAAAKDGKPAETKTEAPPAAAAAPAMEPPKEMAAAMEEAAPM